MSSEYTTILKDNEIIIGRRRAGNKVGGKMVFEFMSFFRLKQDPLEIQTVPPDEMINYYNSILDTSTKITIERYGETTWGELKRQLIDNEMEISTVFSGNRKIY